jgi:hypothetical protein
LTRRYPRERGRPLTDFDPRFRCTPLPSKSRAPLPSFRLNRLPVRRCSGPVESFNPKLQEDLFGLAKLLGQVVVNRGQLGLIILVQSPFPALLGFGEGDTMNCARKGKS